MLLQLHKLFASGGFHRSFSTSSPLSITSHCGGVKSYLGAQLPYSSFGNHCTYGNFGEGQFRKVREGYRISTSQFRDLKFKVKYDSQFLRTLSGRNRHQTTFAFQTQLSARVPFTTTSRNIFTLGNSIRLHVLSYECNGRRLFSSKSKQKFTSLNKNGNVPVRDGGVEDIKASRKAFRATRKRTKSQAVRSSSLDGGKQVATSSQAVKNSASGSSKRVAQTVDVLKPKEQVTGGGKKDVQPGSSNLPVPKTTGNSPKSNTPAKKKQKSKNKRAKSHAVCSSSLDGGKQVATSSQAVKNSASSTSKQVAQTVNVLKPKKQVSGGGKKNVQSGSSILPVTKTTGKSPTSKAQGIKKQKSKNKRAKSQAVRSSSLDGGKQVATSSQAVKNSASGTSKPVNQTVDVLKPKEQVTGGGKKDVQSGSSILPVTKATGNSPTSKAQGIKKQKSKSRRAKSQAVRSSSLDGGKQVVTSSQAVKNSASGTNKPVNQTVDVLKPKEQVTGGGKKDVQSGSSNLPVPKTTGNSPKSNAPAKKKQKSKNKRAKSQAVRSSSLDGGKQVATSSQAVKNSASGSSKRVAQTVDVLKPKEQVTGGGKKDVQSGSSNLPVPKTTGNSPKSNAPAKKKQKSKNKRAKSQAVCSSSLDGGKQVATSSQAVKNSASGSSKRVAQTVDVLKPKEQVTGGGKKDVQSGSSILPATKTTGNSPTSKAQAKKKQKSKKRAKSQAVRSSSLDGGKQVATSSQAVKNSASGTSKPVAQTVGVLKPKEQVTGGGKKDVQSGSSNLPVPKTTGNSPKSKAPAEKKQKSKYKRAKSQAVRSSSLDGGKQVAAPSEAVKSSASGTSKRVAQPVDVLKPKAQVNGGGKKDVQSGSSNLPVPKTTGNSPKSKAPGKKKQKSKNKRAKSQAVRSSSLDGGKQVATSSQAVKSIASGTSKPVAQTVDGLKPKEQVTGGGKKDVQSGSSILPVTKTTGNSPKSKAPVKKKQKSKKKKDVQSGSSILPVTKPTDNKPKSKAPAKMKQKSKNKEHVQGDTGTRVLSGAPEARGSKGVPQPVQKTNITKDSAPAKKKQKSKNKKHVRGDTGSRVLTGAPEARGSKGVSQPVKKTRGSEGVSQPVQKTNITKGSPPSQTSEFTPGRKKSLQAVDNPGLMHQFPKKKTIGKSRKKTLRPLYPPTGKSVVVVESTAKAKIIQRYLGDMFEVLPSNGHVRVLASLSGSVRPDDDFSMVWGVPPAAWTYLKSIKVALHGAKNLILACDPDREGEAIAWHTIEMLRQQGALHANTTVARVVCNEITESSIKSALQSPRAINMDLVHAYIARGALDYLIAYRMTPLLRKKLPGCVSAGRVQSTALALICDRETEIDEFKPQEYWTVEVEFSNKEQGSLDKAHSFSSHLINFDSKKLEQQSIGLSVEAKDIQRKIASSPFQVVGFKRTKTRKGPPKPYITSTLQQDAANKLHFTASQTIKLAKELYEGVKLSNGEATGLISYMRTDGLHISDVAAKDIRSMVLERYGQSYAPKNARKYFKKVKNAQEAHEAIRPTDMRKLPSMLSGVLDEDSLKLYTLIWARTMACQMEPTLMDQIQVDVGGAGQSILLRSTCSKVEFLGYLAAYKDVEVEAMRCYEEEPNVGEEAFQSLTTLKLGDSLHLGKVELKQHFTQSPPRYTEGSLIKKLEELGIGRPSTYSAIIKVLQDRKYLTLKNRVFHPEFRARMVSQFLSHLFSEVNDYSFTADMENELDNVSAGSTEWKGLMKDYWARFSKYCNYAGKMDIRQIEKIMEEALGDILFGSLPGKNRTCPSCSEGTLIFKVTGSGAGYFIGCDKHPKCKYVAKTICHGEEEEEDEEEEEEENPEKARFFEEPKLLGVHPVSKENIFVKKGPYGTYVQLGEDRKGYTPSRAHVCGIKDADSITLELALDLLRYPIVLGDHPDDGYPVYIKLATAGFSLKHRHTMVPVPKNMDPKNITIKKAMELLLGKDAKHIGRPKNKPKAEIYEAM